MNQNEINAVKQYDANRFSVAPMLNWTDRHCRYFHRLMTKNSLLYTEMVTTGAILHGKNDFLAYNQEEHPIALQLGGSNPQDLAKCAQLAQKYGYDEINLNVGCPSDRVQNGKFGACLMVKSQLVADCIVEMKSVVDIPVTIKTRIGIDNYDSYEFLTDFIEVVAQKGGCEQFIIHARKAWLNGLSPKENREIPPLDYARVYQLKQDFSHLTISINGEIASLDEASKHLKYVDGVMVGRKAYQEPYMLAMVDQKIFNSLAAIKTAEQIVEEMYPYIEQQLKLGYKMSSITRHMLGLFQGVAGARQWRRYMSENAYKQGAGIDILQKALKSITSNY